ncbi:unnamed protein product [Camellia sinensis]
MFDSQTWPDCLVSTEIPSVANYLDLHIGKVVLQCGLHQNNCVMGLNFVPARERDNGISTNHCFNQLVISLLFKRGYLMN